MKLTTVPNPILANECAPVKIGDLKSGKHAALIAQMRLAMVAHVGVGLAANQVGRDMALFVIDKKLADQFEVPDAFANPVITEYGRELEALEEGCLSIPGYWVPVRRSKKIMFKALDEHGEKVKFRARGILARVLQHETDHIRGTTIEDRTSKK